MAKYILPRISDMIFLSLFISVILLGPRTFNLDGDLGRHITIGSHILNSRSIPTQDIFSHTLFGEPLTPHEWLSQLIFALAHKGLSLGGPVLVTAILITVTFVLVYYDSRQRSTMPFLSLGMTILAAAASSLHWLARPHAFTFLYLAVWIYLLENIQRGKNVPAWILGLIMLLWANTHGAFIAGFAAWGAYTAGHILESLIQKQWREKELKTWLRIGLLSFIATLFNPHGIRLWMTSFGFIGNTYLVSHTQEYQSINFHTPGSLPFLLMIFLSILALSLKQHRLPASHALLLAGWTIMGLYSARNIPLYVIAAAPILTETLLNSISKSRWMAVESKLLKIDRSVRGALWPLLCVGLAIILLSTKPLQAYDRYDPSVFPVNAVNWLIENPQEGRIFNHFPWGGYLLYRTWPDQLVFIDGQTDFYGEALTREYEQVISLSNKWDSVLEKYQISIVIMPTGSALETTLLQQDDWLIIYQDDTGTILKKDAE
ncbi:MAG: hypothetical protein QY332_13050 [Anaerolineales bacterium]|nr:MAG: hypothetical protein QY332_13050 [Anaerolineales bacterium]